MIIARTPFRISLFGGGTDFPDFFRTHGGAVLAGAINKYCYLSVHRLTPFFKHRFRASYSITESVLEPEAFQHPLIRETLLEIGQREGIEIAHVADLPGQTGLGSSSAFTVGLLHALQAFRRQSPTPRELARQAIRIERERVGDAGGWQDQYVAAWGGFRQITFNPDDTVQVRDLGLDPGRLDALADRLLLFYMGVERSAAAILRAQQDRACANEAALLALRDLVPRAEKLLTGGGPLRELGDLLHAAWQLKRTLAPEISNPDIDQTYAAARAAGARGGKLLGAGGRGFLCLYVEPAAQPAVRAALRPLNEVDFRFSPEGSRIIFQSDE
ncbi:MAG: kinase [Candidatus Marinimicrobia bacterium]|nr:kinase [Candidatus Neomarinimicrobiota bacterium]